MVKCCENCHYILPKEKEGSSGLTHIGCLDKDCFEIHIDNGIWICNSCSDKEEIKCCDKSCICRTEESDQEETDEITDQEDPEFLKNFKKEVNNWINKEYDKVYNMFKNSTIIKNIKVPAKKLHIYQDYIKEQIKKLEGKNYSNEIGYINKLIDVVKIENNIIEKNNFCGSIIYKTTFIVEHCNPEINDEIICKVIQNSNILICEEKPLKIIIIDEISTENLQKDDKIIIKILCKEIIYNSGVIKIVGEFITKIL